MFIIKDYQDENECFNLLIEFKSPDQLKKINNWCKNNLSINNYMITDLYESCKILRLVCTFLKEADVNYVRSLVIGKKPGKKLTLIG
jgi:hypothetical protein